MAQSSPLILRFFGLIWKIVRAIIRICVTVFVLGVIAVVCIAVFVPTGPKVPKKAALVWTPQGTLVESISHGAGRALRHALGEAPTQSSLAELKVALQRAAGDDRIKMAVLNLGHLEHAGMAQLQALREAIRDFEASGKKVIAYAPSYDQRAYYLAAQADAAYMGPMGSVLLKGFGIYPNYFKDALDKLHIKVHVFRRGRYKSAVEPFIRNDMSDAAKHETTAWLNDLWGVYVHNVAAARDIKPRALNDYANTLPDALIRDDGDGAHLARQAGLVDRLVNPAQLRRMVGKVVGLDRETGRFSQIGYRDYVTATGGLFDRQGQHQVGLIVAEGAIKSGKGKDGVIGGNTLATELNRARTDPDIAAVVMRVNSPGGSAAASERIRQAVMALEKAGKPVVVSMSSMAASGGYWISMNANQIWARASTITGSIGIFAIIPDFSRALNKIGIHSGGVGTNRYTGALRLNRPLKPKVAKAVQAVINNGYHHFITNVAHARKMKVSRVDSIGEGHVWSGLEAKKLGLVDHLGGLDSAIQAAWKLADLRGKPVVHLIRKRRGLSAQLLQFLASASTRLGIGQSLPIPAWLRELVGQHSQVASLAWMDDPRHMYAYWPYRPDLGGDGPL